jgi:choline dehydrogenase-like flavoprotein
MFLDGRQVPSGTAPDVDLAIIGAGAAGITLARALKDAGFTIALIESGGLEWSEAAQQLGAGEVGAQRYGDLANVRLRQFGGTTGHWGGWCRELDALDFEPRAFVPLSGWPISKADLAPHYAAAQDILQLGPARYGDFTAVAAAAGAARPIAPDGAIEAVLFELSPPTRMGEVYRSELEQSAVQVWLNTTLSDIRLSDDLSHVTELRLARDGAEALTMRARHVVLACGGLSNPQILLASNSQIATGIGNGHDFVGRCFAEHPVIEDFAALIPLGPETGAPFVHGEIALDAYKYRLAFQPTQAHRRAAQRLSALMTINWPGPRLDPATGQFDWWDEHRFGPPETAVQLVALSGQRAAHVHMLGAGFETRPNPDSRVMLATTRDRFGTPQIRLDWRLSDVDLADYLANLADLGGAFMAAGTAMVRIAPDAHERFRAETFWGHHHMGTTRMGHDPKTSVCDGVGRVHGLPNLWVAGSSLFPTTGAANPTLTIVALALRLAAHLKEALAA